MTASSTCKTAMVVAFVSDGSPAGNPRSAMPSVTIWRLRDLEPVVASCVGLCHLRVPALFEAGGVAFGTVRVPSGRSVTESGRSRIPITPSETGVSSPSRVASWMPVWQVL